MDSYEFKALIDEHGNSIYRFCKGMTYTEEDAEDLYQQTFLTAFEKRSKLDSAGNPKAYLMSIASNLWRNQKSTYARHQRIAPTVSYEEVEHNVTGDTDDMLDKTIQADEEKSLRECIDQLPDKLKQVILMYYSSELSIEDIAKALHIPKGTVKSRLHNAKDRLKEMMESEVNI